MFASSVALVGFYSNKSEFAFGFRLFGFLTAGPWLSSVALGGIWRVLVALVAAKINTRPLAATALSAENVPRALEALNTSLLHVQSPSGHPSIYARAEHNLFPYAYKICKMPTRMAV